MLKILQKLFIKSIGGSRNDRIIRSCMNLVHEKINPLETMMQSLDDNELRAASLDLRKQTLAGDVKRNDVLPQAFALIREASRRGRNHRQYDVQLVAGMILDRGWIAEEATGEGKTIACYPAIYMAWLEGFKTHVVTVNDYLVERDANFAKPIFELLGVTVGFIRSEMPAYGDGATARRAAYECDVTYGTNSEFGFDYLRDNMKMSPAEQVQGRLDFAIVDEVDSILIDEARTPLIISGPAYGKTDRYNKADAVARELISRNRPYDQANRQVENLTMRLQTLEGELKKNKKSDAADKLQKQIEQTRDELVQAEDARSRQTQYYEVVLDKKSAHMTHEGVTAAQEIAGVGSFYVGANMEWPHLMEQALRAHLVYERDKDYVVQDGQIVIVDEFTGRLLEGRQWSDGLHQAVEAKERVTVKEENQTLATITLQNYFKLYKKLAGMTGTAMTEAEEFAKIYKLDVASVPTNVPCCRNDSEDRIYADEDAKFKAIVEEINEYSKTGRPVLVGTTSIEKSEKLSQMLVHTYGIEHELLNGRPENAAREAEIVFKAGQQHELSKKNSQMVGNVTIATNMAGRGTDIKLSDGAKQSGGLHIVGTERHEARRIDNQLRGRAGRQGDPGSSRFFLSLEDDLMSIFAGDWTKKMLAWLGLTGDMAIENKRISNGIERAQKKVEERNFEIRKNLLEYDEIMDVQRHGFYSMRQAVLEGRNIQRLVFRMVNDSIASAAENFLDGSYPQRCIGEWARNTLQAAVRDEHIKAKTADDMPSLEADLREAAKSEAYATIAITLGEYMDEELEASAWDLRGLSSWAKSRFGVDISQNQLRKMNPHEVEQALCDSAAEKIDKIDLSPLLECLEPDFAKKSFAGWANSKFNLGLSGDDFDGTAQQAVEKIMTGVHELYRRRQVEYPVEYAVEMTVGRNGEDNIYALEELCRWANVKFGTDFTAENLQGKNAHELLKMLTDISHEWLEGDKLSQCINGAAGIEPSVKDAIEFAKKRFYTELAEKDFEGCDVLEKLIEIGRLFLTRELAELERFVLLQIFDQSWKDHLLSMDHLKSAIGLRGYAEQDPKVAYKREGGKLFEEMFAGIREKLSSMIFKVRLASREDELESVYQVSEQVHEQLHGYGHLAQGAGQAAQQPGESQKIKQIVRQDVKVGRNDPCPCGSGKKYKKCCGRM
ncbi:MAG TPA: SEC-C metal-binding domain-containing protein [Phycisphaerae bacterium]|nr:SEC-C metal-binding domain-containing protein [Phycisphaerae bacterium]